MNAFRVAALAAAALPLVASGCAPASRGNAAAPARTTYPLTGVAYTIGEQGTASATKSVEVIDTTNGALLGRLDSLVPGAHTEVGPIVLTPDGRDLYITAYDTKDPAAVRAGLYHVDLTTGTSQYLTSLGSGIPGDATLTADRMLDVLVSDASAPAEVAQNRIVAIDLRTGTAETHDNPLPVDRTGRLPVPIAIVADPLRRLVYLTDASGTIYAVRPNGFRFYRSLDGAGSNFTANGASTALDAARGMIYQLGLFATTDDRLRPVTNGAVLATSIRDGGKRLVSLSFTPVSGALLDRAGRELYFGSFFAPSPGLPFVSRFDIARSQIVTRPILASYGNPEFLNTGRIALSGDDARLLVPVSVAGTNGSASSGALLEFDPALLTLKQSVAVPEDLQSGGVVAN